MLLDFFFCKFLCVGTGICSKVEWNAAAPTSFHRSRLEVVHIIGWFLPQAAGVVVLVTKPSSIGIQPRWIIWSQSVLFECVKLVFLSVFAVSSFWFSQVKKEECVKRMNGQIKSFSVQPLCEEFQKDGDRCGSPSWFYHSSETVLYFSLVSIYAHKGLK